MKDQTKVIAALLIGAAAGAALGLLLAPEKGETLRDGIADYINDLLEAAKDTAQAKTNDIKQYGNSIYDKAKAKFSGAADDVNDYKDATVSTVKAKAHDLNDEAHGKISEAKSKLKNGSNEVNDAIQKA